MTTHTKISSVNNDNLKMKACRYIKHIDILLNEDWFRKIELFILVSSVWLQICVGLSIQKSFLTTLNYQNVSHRVLQKMVFMVCLWGSCRVRRRPMNLAVVNVAVERRELNRGGSRVIGSVATSIALVGCLGLKALSVRADSSRTWRGIERHTSMRLEPRWADTQGSFSWDGRRPAL